MALPDSGSPAATVGNAMIPLINKLSFVLQVEVMEADLSGQPALPHLIMTRASRIGAVTIDKASVNVYDNDAGTFTPLTQAQLEQVAYDQPAITFTSETKPSFTKQAPAGKTSFTVGDILDAIAAFEQYDRPSTDWFGGPDCHHVFFEGMEASSEGWYIAWGS
jgi:hypothetical protein